VQGRRARVCVRDHLYVLRVSAAPSIFTPRPARYDPPLPALGLARQPSHPCPPLSLTAPILRTRVQGPTRHKISSPVLGGLCVQMSAGDAAAEGPFCLRKALPVLRPVPACSYSSFQVRFPPVSLCMRMNDKPSIAFQSQRGRVERQETHRKRVRVRACRDKRASLSTTTQQPSSYSILD